MNRYDLMKALWENRIRMGVAMKWIIVLFVCLASCGTDEGTPITPECHTYNYSTTVKPTVCATTTEGKANYEACLKTNGGMWMCPENPPCYSINKDVIECCRSLPGLTVTEWNSSN